MDNSIRLLGSQPTNQHSTENFNPGNRWFAACVLDFESDECYNLVLQASDIASAKIEAIDEAIRMTIEDMGGDLDDCDEDDYKVLSLFDCGSSKPTAVN